jgi:vacuolar-type H+-ATPase subunit H
MEIFTLLETLEDMLERSKTVPFTDKSIVSRNEFLDIIKEIRLKLPDELKQAKWIKEERERIITEAQKDAEDIVKEAENRIISMIDEHEITKQANEKKKEIIATANDMYREYEDNGKAIADATLRDVEETMTKLCEVINSVEMNLQSRIETVKEERKQLK